MSRSRGRRAGWTWWWPQRWGSSGGSRCAESRRHSSDPRTETSCGELLSWGVSAVGISALNVVVGSIVLAEIDLRTRRLPREISYPLFGSMLLCIGISSWHEGTSRRLVDALVGAAIVTGVLLVLHLASRGGLGDGDVRLAPALGSLAFVGGVETVWIGLFVAFVSAGIGVALLMALGRASRSSTVPFGPFLIGGALSAVLLTTP